MPTRQPRPSLETLEATASEQAPLAIPPGARVRVDFDAPVDTSSLVNESRYPDELAALAADEADEDELELSPVVAFCSTWARFDGYLMHVSRLPDPGNKRVPGQTYNRTCLEIESLGSTTFDPRNFEGTLQLLNGNSGGVFRVWLLDNDGRPIPSAHLSRVAVSDPLNFKRDREREPQQYTPPPKPEPSALELRMQQLQERLLENALTRLMTPPAEPQPVNPQSTLTDEQKLTLILAERGAILPGVVENLVKLASAGGPATRQQTWSEWLQETGGELLRTNPEIGERIMNTASNLVALFLNRLPAIPQAEPQLPQQPQQRLNPAPQSARAAITDLPEVPNPDDDIEVDPVVDQDASIEDATMIVLEDLIGLLISNEQLRADHPVFVRLNTEYPVVFQQAIKLIAQYPLDAIIAWVKSKGAIYASLLDGEATGPHLRQRLQQLKDLANAPAPAPAPAPPASEQATNVEVQNATPPPAPKRRRSSAS